MKEDAVEIARLQAQVESLERSLERVENMFLEYVTRHEFTPVKNIAYGLVTLLMSTVVLAILKLIIIGK